ncbi:hypothetical protein JCM8208_005742 [Rhodotorula glutinis]
MQSRSHSAPTPTRRARSGEVARGDEEEVRVAQAEEGKPEGLRVDKEAVQDLVAYLLSPSSSPSRRKVPSSTRRLVSPNLLVSLPLLPVPEPTHGPPTTTPMRELVTTSQQALTLFRLPSLAVSVLPFASWQLRVYGVEETSLAITVPGHVGPSLKGKEREVEHIEHAEHVQVVERWSANVEWTLRIDSPLAKPVGRDVEKKQRSAWLESMTASRKVELVFASRPHPASSSRGRQPRGVASFAGGERSVSSSSYDDGAEHEIGATSSAGLVEQAAEEEHSLELVYLRYAGPAPPLSFLAHPPLPDLVRFALAALLPIVMYLLALVGLDQQLKVDTPPHVVKPRLAHHMKRKLESPSSSLWVGVPAPKRRKYRDPAPPVASTSASREREPAIETAHVVEVPELHVGKHAHLARRRRWSVSTPTSIPASRSASGSSATLQATPERVPGPSPWAPRLPVGFLSAVELVGAVCAGIVATCAELAVLLWAVRQAILFATELVEEGWVVAKEVLREHKRESIQHRHVTFSASSPPPPPVSPASAAPPSPSSSSSTLSGDSPSTRSPSLSPSDDDREPALARAGHAPAEHDRPDAAAAYALSQLHALVSRQAAAEGRVLAPTLAAEYSLPGGEHEGGRAEARTGREGTVSGAQLGGEEQARKGRAAQTSLGYEFPSRSMGPRARSSADDNDDAEHSASTSAPGLGGRLSPFSALSQGDVASAVAASQPSSRRSSLAPYQPSPRRPRAEDVGPPVAASARRSSLGVAGRSAQAQQAAASSRTALGSGEGTEREQESCGPGEQHCAWRGDTSSSNASPADYYTPQGYASPITPMRPHSAGSSPHSSPEDPIPSEYRIGSSTSTSAATPTSARPTATRSSSDSAVELSALGPQSVFAPAFHPAVMGIGAGRGFQPRPRPGHQPPPVPQYLPQHAPAPQPQPQPHPQLYARPPPLPQRQLYVPPQPAGLTITLSSDEEEAEEESGTTTTSGSPSGGRTKTKQRGKKKKKGRRGAGGGGDGESGAPKEEDPLAAAGGSLSRLPPRPSPSTLPSSSLAPSPVITLQTRRSFGSLSSESKGAPSSSSAQQQPQQPALHIDVDAVNTSTSPASSSASSSAPSLASAQSRPGRGRTMSDPNAKVVEVTQAEGSDTYGSVNQHPKVESPQTAFKVGVSVDRNKKCRRTMEDAHSFIYDFGGIRGQGYFAVFDGHAGKHAAEWCGHHFHEHLLDNLRKAPVTPIPDLLNATFHTVDTKLSELAASGNTHSGCTAVTCFLRLEDDQGQPAGDASGVCSDVVAVKEGQQVVADEGAALRAAQAGGSAPGGSNASTQGSPELKRDGEGAAEGGEAADKASGGHSRRRSAHEVKSRLKNLLTGRSDDFTASSSSSLASGSSAGASARAPAVATPNVEIAGPAVTKSAAKRTLYTANVGDARAVLSRGGRAVRLTYDHKGSDAKEAKRISDAGGFVLNNRVNGVLAVTRSLGDSSMKEFVVGSPFTTETTLGPQDEWLIVACDGLWDVCSDQEAVDLIKDIECPQEASQKLLDHALSSFSTDNLSILCVRLNNGANP